ncbi:MAG: type II secretion system F family protein, partial [Oligoflexus sp.]
MPIYSYKGYEAATGANVKGRIDADSERTARQTLRQRQKIIVAEIKEEKASDNKGKSSLSLFNSRVSLDEMAVMIRQFATLQGAYVPLDETLKALVQQVDNDTLRKTLAALKDSVSEGKSLAESASAYPNVFNRLFVNMVRAGESSGTLSTVLERLAEFTEYQVTTRGKITQAMTYPSIMIFASLGVVGFLLVFIVPKLAKVFTSLKVTIPWYTQALMSFSLFLQNYWYVPLVTIVLVVYLSQRWLASEKGRRKFDKFLISAPVIGPVFMMLAVSRFTKTLSTLLSSGVPIIPALDITKNVVNNMVLTDVLEQAKIEVQEGNSL